MKKTALKDDILLKIEKPARYIGNEVNAVMKDKNQVDIRFAMCFPDVYEIGMSHIGLQILYGMFNEMDQVWCERVFSPWGDLDALMREKHIPLFALESQDEIQAFDFLGITLQYEMCYTNILQILDLSGIALRAKDRKDEDPVVIGGGPCAYNPEPVADFFDMFYIGEGEVSYETLFNAYRENKKSGGNREDFLLLASNIPGIYVPGLYCVTYDDRGLIRDFTPDRAGVPAVIKKQIADNISEAFYPEKPVVPFIKVTQDRAVLEVQRGCIRGCRFCQAGIVYRPTRERNVDKLKDIALKILNNTGYDEISLSSLSTSDYSELKDMIDFLISEVGEKHINISLPSLRIDSFSLEAMARIQDVRKGSLTFAPEAGTQRLRNVINKGITEEDIMSGALEAFRGGWHKVKLYFMLGLPTEVQEDRQNIPALADRVARQYYSLPREGRQGKCQITFSTSFFIPKPFTPFQWCAMSTPEEYITMAEEVKSAYYNQLNKKSLKYNWHDPEVTIIEGALARGDRRLSDIIQTAYNNGCMFDAWSDLFSYERWLAAFEENGLSPDFYTRRERTVDEHLPWDFIDVGVDKTYLIREWDRALRGEITPNCREKCSGCGAVRWKKGVCIESQD